MILSVSEAGTSPRSACAVLVDWANEQDHWVRRVVQEVLSTRQALPESALDAVYQAILAEKELASDPAKEVTPSLPRTAK
jgi:hypothetical protein